MIGAPLWSANLNEFMRKKRKKQSSTLKVVLCVVLFIISFIIFKQTFDWLVGEVCTEIVDYYKKPKNDEDIKVHESHYDFTTLAESITQDCNSDYEKIRAIYKWLCDNIEYDTDYRIYHADECYDARKGVCQAYCELFYYLAKAVGVKSEIISGNSRDSEGHFSEKGHAWIFAYTRKNHGILMDPTWGAGSVNGRNFTRSKNCWHWFNVDPRWMILRHYPKEEEYQLLDDPISIDEFKSLSVIDEAYLDYGLDVKDAYEAAINHTSNFPKFYSSGISILALEDYPRTNPLQIGEFYEFRIKLHQNERFTIINDKLFVEDSEWEEEGDGIYSIKFMPQETGTVKLAIKNTSDGLWYSCVEYKVKSPSQSDWDNVEEYYPLAIPQAKSVRNLNADRWKNVGVSETQLLKALRQTDFSELPDIYTGKGQKFTVETIPMKKNLTADKIYEFTFYPKSGIKWAMVNNSQWYYDWYEHDDGKYTMMVSPKRGKLTLYVQFQENDSYWPALEYIVQ